MKKFQLPAWTVPPALLLLCLVSYGLLFNKLGFYWDDWPAIWFTHFFGSSSLMDVLGIDRPQLAWLYFLTTSLIGESKAGWQLFSLVMRWLSCLALWWTLLQVWPKQRTEATWVAFLFALYPGFRQQYIALIYSHDWIVISLFLLSIGLMIGAIRRPKWFWPFMCLSWVMAAYTMFADEYYFGLELLRPVLLWIVLRDTDHTLSRSKLLKKVFLYWLPYIGIMLAFMVWRLFLHVSPRGQVQIFDQIANNPLIGLSNLAKTIGLDIWESGLVAWSIPFNLKEVINSGITSIYIYLILAAGVAGLIIFYLIYLARNDQPSKINDNGDSLPGSAVSEPSKQWAIQAALIGVYALFIAGWPFWATNWQIGLTFPWDRFNLAMNLGACLLLISLLVLIFRRRLYTIIALGVIIGLASASAFHLANYYRQDWELTKRFFWQLSWRVPGIEPDTVLLTYRPPFTYSTDNSLTAPLNWIYAQELDSEKLPYLFYDVASHSPFKWNSLDSTKALQQQYRIMNFSGSFSRAISVFYEQPNCVKVMEPLIDSELPAKPLYITPGALFSKTELIDTDPAKPASPPVEIFGPEPAHDWCYYFEKAELARQSGDWQQVAELADLALPGSPVMTEANALEWIPFIEGFARAARWDEADKLSQQVYDVHPKMRRMLCSLWERVLADTPASSARNQVLERQNSLLNCSLIDEN
jgi:hypothetical protein